MKNNKKTNLEIYIYTYNLKCNIAYTRYIINHDEYHLMSLYAK